ALRLNAKLFQAWCNRGLNYLELDQPEKALADFDKALALEPRDALSWSGRGNTRSRLGRFAEAKSDFETALKYAPGSPRMHNDLAWLLATCPDVKLRDSGKAVEYSQKAVRLAPKVANYWTTLGVAYYRASDWKAAVTTLEKAVQMRGAANAVDGFYLAM